MIYEDTQYGFKWDSGEITRLASDNKKGWVVIELKTKKETIQLYVTKTGKVRIHTGSIEWVKENNERL